MAAPFNTDTSLTNSIIAGQSPAITTNTSISDTATANAIATSQTANTPDSSLSAAIAAGATNGVSQNTATQELQATAQFGSQNGVTSNPLPPNTDLQAAIAAGSTNGVTQNAVAATPVAATSIANNYKVRLIAVSSLLSGTSSTSANQVIFEVSPTSFTESGDVEYETVAPVHMPGGIQVYKRTNSRRFSISAKFISRTVKEATQNLQYLQILRAWRMPYFGTNSATSFTASPKATAAIQGNLQMPSSANPVALTPQQQSNTAGARITQGINLLGAPPDVLYLYAYSTGKNDARQDNGDLALSININRVPVVLVSLSISYPDDVDYLPTYNNYGAGTINETSEPFPTKMEVSIELTETHSPNEYEQFSLSAYKQGKLANF